MPVVDISINLDGAQRRQASQGRPAKRARERGQAKEEGQGEERRDFKGTILNVTVFMIHFSLFELGLQAACPHGLPDTYQSFRQLTWLPRQLPGAP